MSILDEQLKLTNSYISRNLGYIRDSDIFFTKFLAGLDRYINLAGGVLSYTCDGHNKPIMQIDKDTDLVYLKRLLAKLNISLDYFPDSETVSETTLKELYSTAIRGAVVSRKGNSTKSDLKNILQAMYPESEIIILDGGIGFEDPTYPGMMYVSVIIKGYTSTLDKAILALYLKEDITGVGEQFNFEILNSGVFAPVEESDSSNPNFKEYINNINSYTGPYYNNGAYTFMTISSSSDMLGYTEDIITSNPPKFTDSGLWLIQLI